MNITQRMYFGQFPLDKDRDRRIVFYGRVSTQHEAQVDALGNQMQWYDDQLRYHPNWQVVDRYIDEGITGTSAKKRPAFMKMLSDAKCGKFDLIVTREVCRFARNTVDTLQLTRELRNFGVEVFFVSDNIWTMDGDGELRLSIMATMAQEESRKISERVLAGQKISRQNGVLYGSGNIIGYDRDKVNRTYVINEEQAATIRMVFTLYSQGYGEKAIVNELSRLGRKDGHGNVSWSCTKISRILRNATYMGYVCYNKSKVNNYLEKKRINNLDETSFVYVKGNFEPIVSEALWHECERIRKSRIVNLRLPDGETRRKGIDSTKYLWVAKLRCRCGSSYRIFNWRKLKDGKDIAVITIGPIGNTAAHAIERAEAEKGLSIAHYDLRFAKPLDEELLLEVGAKFRRVVTVEDGALRGGVGEAVAAFFNARGLDVSVRSLGIGDEWVEHGTPTQLYALCGYDEEGILRALLAAGE